MAKTDANLENNRIIHIQGTFNEEMASKVLENIISMEMKDPTKDILLVIDSFGGYLHSFIAIHDAIKLSRCDISTLCIGKAMSCGQLLLMSGTKGKRFSTENSRILVHELSSATWGKLTDMEIDIKESKELRKLMNVLMKKYTSLSQKKIDKLMARDSFMSAKEAKKLGIIDHVVKNNKDLYKRINL
jgi:ATP-dependent Clp protease protease subunit